MGACALVVAATAVAVARGLAAGTVSVARAGEQDVRQQAPTGQSAGDGADGAEAAGDGGAAAPSGSGPSGAQGQAAGEATEAPGTILVHVDGEVASPGVVELPAGSPRVRDAVEAAGGLTERAATTSLNLAAPVEDGSKVHVPNAEEAAEAGAGATTGAGTAGQGAAGQAGSSSSARVNVNTATAEELQQLPGVGPSTAAKIVEDRAKNGPFASVDDLMRVSGIGEKKLERLRGQAYV